MRARILLATVMAAAACTPSFPIPPGAQLTCAQDADCPADFRCNADTQLCVNRQESPPTSAPSLALPAGQTALKGGDLLTVSGSCEAGARVFAARLVNAADGAELQAVPAAAVTSTGGVLGGGFLVAPGLPHGANVALEVIVQARGFLSVPENSRSLPAQVDTDPPRSTSIALASGATLVAAPAVTLALSALGATELFLDGDLVDGPAVRQWLPYATGADVQLAGGNGSKVLLARYRDGAHNVVQASVAVELDTTVPASQPELHGTRWPLAKVRNSEALTVLGSAAPGTVVSSALLLAVDGAGAPLAGCEVDVTSQVTIGPGGNLGGTLNVGTPCAGAAGIRLQVRVRNQAGSQSIPELSRSNVLALDNQAPLPATAALQPVPGARTGQTRFQDVVLLLGAERDGTAQILIDGDVQNGARTRAWVDFPGTEAVPGEEVVTLSLGDGPKAISVRFRDEVGNEAGPVTVNVLLDRTPPPAPVAGNLQLVEASPAPRDPSRVADSNNTFTLAGLNGAIVNGDRIQVFADAALSTSLAVVPADSGGAFPATLLLYNTAETWYAVALDPAGNVSAASTPVALPQLTGLAATPQPGRAGAPLTIGFTTSVVLAAPPAVTVDGNAATCGPPLVRTWSCSYTPSGAEPEGANAAVLRVVARDGSGGSAPTSQGTQAIPVTLDFQAPALAAGQVTVAQNDPSIADSISGAANAATDNLAAGTAITVRVFRGDGTTPISAVAARADGSFGPVAIGDNANARVVVKLEDPAGNLGAGTAFDNDVAVPAISALAAAPAAQHAGADVTVSFSVTDGASDLRAPPAVTVAGNAALLVSGTTGTSDGQPHPFVYRYTVRATDAEQTHPVVVSVTDSRGNSSAAQTTVLIDRTPPASANTTPGNRSSWNGSPGALGTASDGLSGLAAVQVSLRAAATGQWWNGSAFASATESWLTATGTSSWSFPLAGIPFLSGQSYVLRWRAVDVAGNVELPTAGATFTFDPALPNAPASLTATPVREARVDLAWAAVAGAASYRVYYDVEAGTHPPYGGSGAAEGSSPITVPGAQTTLTVNRLPRGRYVFAVTAVDSSMRESAYSVQAAAASRWFKWSSGMTTPNPVNRLISTGPNRFVGVGGGGTVWLTSDAGASWQLRWAGAQVGNLLDVVQAGTSLVAVGTGGIVRSTDGGQSWSLVRTLASPVYFNRSAYASGSHVVVISQGSGELLLHSADGGATFSSITPPVMGTPQVLGGAGDTVVVFFSPGAAVRSLDGGATWSAATTTTGELLSVYLSGSQGVAVGGAGRLVVTSNAGASWAPPTGGSPLTGNIDLAFGLGPLMFAADNSNGIVARSPDGGASWTTSTGHAVNLRAGWTDGTTVLLTGPSNGFSRSVNGGSTWTINFGLPGVPSVNPSTLASDGATVIGGDSAFGGGTGKTMLARSVDLGLSWSMPPSLEVSRTVWTAGTRIAVHGQSLVYRSLDGGDTWTPFDPGFSPITMIGGDGTAMLIGGRNAAFDWALARSTDSGQTFTQVASWTGTGPSQFTDVAASGSTWVAVTETGYIVRSTDGGLTWPSFQRPVTTSLTTVRASGSQFFAYGVSGVLLRSTDGGLTWGQVATGVSAELTADWFGPSVILLGTSTGQVIRSTNGGAAFSMTGATSLINRVTSLWASADGLTFLAGAQGGDRISRSTDGGLGWALTYNPALPGGQHVALIQHAGTFYAFVRGKPLASADGSPGSWLPVPDEVFVPVPVAAPGAGTYLFTNGWATAGGLPFAVTRGGALALGPP